MGSLVYIIPFRLRASRYDSKSHCIDIIYTVFLQYICAFFVVGARVCPRRTSVLECIAGYQLANYPRAIGDDPDSSRASVHESVRERRVSRGSARRQVSYFCVLCFLVD